MNESVPATAETGSFLVDAEGANAPVDRSAIQQRLASGTFFWLDLHGPSADDLALLADPFHFHPLAIEDSTRFGQRPKFDDYGDHLLLVAYGADETSGELVEVHLFLSERFLVTVHHDDCPPFEGLRQEAVRRHLPTQDGARLVHAVVDVLADSFFPVLDALDDRIDVLESGVLERPDQPQLEEMFALKRRLVEFRKIVSPQRDLFARITTGVLQVPGMTIETEHYYRDVYDHLIRVSDLIDSYRDLLTGAMDLYLSTVSNRLNEVMKKLTLIATVFLPLTWLTGFFGMNFAFMVRHIGGAGAFIAFGLLTQAVAGVLLYVFFRRSGWV